MKLNRIKALCLENGVFEIVNGPHCQWLGNGNHYFRVYGARLAIDELDKLLSVSDKKAAACSWDEYDYKDDAEWSDTWQNSAVELTPVADVWGYEQQLLALDCAGSGVLLVRYDALNALEPDARRKYRLQNVNGRLFVALVDGFMTVALLSPLEHDDTQRLLQAMGRVVNMGARYFGGGDVDEVAAK